MRAISFAIVMLASLAIAGCATSSPSASVAGTGSQVQLRQIQTREYDTLDRAMTLRSVIATLQDLSFVIDKADADLGTVTATRHDNYLMRMTVTVRKKDSGRIAVRANARINETAVEDPKTYQDFFVALDKSMFLTAQKVD